MAAGFIDKVLATLKDSTALWFENALGKQGPVHGSILLDPVTGLALDVAAATLTVEKDCVQVTNTVAAAADLWIVDTTGFKSLNVQITSIGTGNTITFETSSDGASWNSCNGVQTNAGTGLPQATMNVTGPFEITKFLKYVKARVSTYGSGNVTAIAELRSKNGITTVDGTMRVRPSNSSVLCPTPVRIQSGASANPTNVKTSSGAVMAGIVCNQDAAAMAYLKLYNKASSPVVGTDVPIATIQLPPKVPVKLNEVCGHYFTTGISYAITAGTGLDTDTNVVAAAQVTGWMGYA